MYFYCICYCTNVNNKKKILFEVEVREPNFFNFDFKIYLTIWRNTSGGV